MKYEHQIQDVTISWRSGQSCISIHDNDRVLDVMSLPDEEPVMDEIELYADGWIMNMEDE